MSVVALTLALGLPSQRAHAAPPSSAQAATRAESSPPRADTAAETELVCPARCIAPPAPEAEPKASVDLNKADESELVGLPGIGPSRARAILAYRSSHGGFRSISQLLHIKGIGRALLKQLRPLITLSGVAS